MFLTFSRPHSALVPPAAIHFTLPITPDPGRLRVLRLRVERIRRHGVLQPRLHVPDAGVRLLHIRRRGPVRALVLITAELSVLSF